MIEIKVLSTQVVTQVLRACRGESLRVALLRHKEIDCSLYESGDVDLVIDRRDLLEFLKIAFLYCRENNVSCHFYHQKKGKHVIKIGHYSSYIKIELWTHIECFRYRDSVEVIEVDRNVMDCIYTEKGIPVLAVYPGLLVYIIHLSYKNKDLGSLEVKHRLSKYYDQLLLDEDISDVLKIKMKQCYDMVLDRSLGLSAHESKIILEEKGFKFSRIKNRKIMNLSHFRKGKLICFSGPDGSGKTTVGKRISGSCGLDLVKFKNLYRKSIGYRKRYGVSEDSIPPNIWEERNSFLVLSVALLNILKSRARCAISKSAKPMLFYDRYFLDYLHVGLRESKSEYGSGIRKVSLYNLFSCLYPSPNLIVLCSCPEEIRVQRKPNELTTYSSDLLVNTYLEYASRTGTPVFVYPTHENYCQEEMDCILFEGYLRSPQ